ncbi:MAG: hypothetical protein KDJ37_06965 [Hyphomicrobiaceae bacterium]|nr:hypothetical protein [Hyphomicrobiaceae bacterium]
MADASLAEGSKQTAGDSVGAKQQIPYLVDGFRSAKFGMGEAEVRSAAAKDFGMAPDAIQRVENPADGTAGLVARLDKLEPAPGPATVTYVFGASSKKLVQVNVVWLSQGDEAKKYRLDYIGAAQRLASYFIKHRWRDDTVLTGVRIGPDSMVAFIGKDEQGRAVEVRLDGVPLFKDKSGEPINQGALLGPVRLRLSYASETEKPDIKRIPKGAF